MEEVFESENEVVVPKVKKPRKKRVVSEATKERLRAQLKKGRETARLNRLKKKNAKAGIKSKPKLVASKKVEDTPEPKPEPKPDPEPVVKKIIIEKVAEPKPEPKSEPKPELPPPKPKEEPRVVNKPLETTAPIPIVVPLPYQSTFRKARRKW